MEYLVYHIVFPFLAGVGAAYIYYNVLPDVRMWWSLRQDRKTIPKNPDRSDSA